MKEIVVEQYRISGNKVTHMKLQSLSLPENETLSMIKRYHFDKESTDKMLSEAQRCSEEWRIAQEQEEYEEMNHDAIYMRLSALSTLEVLKRLFRIS